MRNLKNWIVGNKLILSSGVLLLLAAIFLVLFVLRDWGPDFGKLPCGAGESRSTTLRNLALSFGGIIAIWVAIWRGFVADRQAKTLQRQVETSQQQVEASQKQVEASQTQAKASQKQVEASQKQVEASLKQAKALTEQVAASQKQVETAQRSLLNERYQKGAEMLGRAVLSVRLGGIYALQRLSEEDQQKHYQDQIMDLFCAFVRHPTEDTTHETSEQERVREDVEVALRAIIECRGGAPNRLNLTNAKLPRANLAKANLKNANLAGGNLTNANLSNADLTGADLRGSTLTDTNLAGANLTSAKLTGSDANTQRRLPAKGLTQEQLDIACADPQNPPDLDGVQDDRTDARLEWRGKCC